MARCYRALSRPPGALALKPGCVCVPSREVIGEWLDVDGLNIALVGGIASLAVAALVALRLIRKLVLAVFVAVVLVGAAGVLAVQWTGLRNCRETCTCEVFGRSVDVPTNPLCGPNRLDPDRIDVDIDISTRSGSR